MTQPVDVDRVSSSENTTIQVHETDEKNPASPKKENLGAEEESYPEGGLQAWLVLFGGVCINFSTFGYVNAWGAFQEYYQDTILHDTSPSSIAWIGSIQYCLIFLPGLVMGRWFDIGYFKLPLLVSSAFLVTATFLIAQCTVYWQFLLCQGFAVGIAAGAVFVPNMTVVAQYFNRRRGVAFGILASGSSIGGTVFPIAVRKLIPLVGFQWTIRIVGFILMFSLSLTNLTMKRRLPPSNAPGGQFNLKIFKSTPFTVYCISAVFTFLGLYTLLTFIGVSATHVGITGDLSFYLVSIANAASLFGRLSAGWASDYMGPITTMVPMTLLAAIMTFIWPHVSSSAGLIVISLIYGFASGSYVSLLANPIFTMGSSADNGRRLGLFWGVLCIGALVGPPISGAIYHKTGGFSAVGWYAGSVVCVGVIMMAMVKRLAIGSFMGRF